MTAPRARLLVLGVAAVALLVTAAVVWSRSGPATYGWFAYAPLSDAAAPPSFSLLTPGMQAALALAAAGLVLLAGLGGFWLGRRGRSAPRPAGTQEA